ncbi:hypothetical protein M2305_002726 [Gluconobacter cerinus]|nr:hypothetical protein [Gluconobacter cerinus]
MSFLSSTLPKNPTKAPGSPDERGGIEEPLVDAPGS